MNIWIEFVTGLCWGLPFGVVFNIPKYGRLIMLLGIGIIAVAILTDPSFVAIGLNKPWYAHASYFFGIVVGQLSGEFVLNQAIEAWKA